MKLKFEINLKKFSSLAVAEALWDSAVVKKEIKLYASRIFDTEDDRELEERWRDVTQKVIKLSGSLQLPDDLLKTVESTVAFLSEKVLVWVTNYIKSEGPVPIKRLYWPKIYWTQHGVIDDWKYYQAWRKNASRPFRFVERLWFKFRFNDELELLRYTIASMYADENLIRESLTRIAKLVMVMLGVKIKDVTKFKVNSAMSVLLLYYRELSTRDLKFDVLYPSLKSKEYPRGTDKMFLHCVKMRLKKPAEYFYNRLKENDKQSIVQQALLECLSKAYVDGQVALYYVLDDQEKIQEMVLYLLGKMTWERRRIFLLDKVAEVYTCFLSVWPYQELCTPLLDFFWAKVPKTIKFNFLKGLFTILKNSSESKHYTFTSNIYHPLVKDLLARSSYELKKYLYTGFNVIFNLFKIPDFASIDVILEDSDSNALRWEIIDISKFLPYYLMQINGHTKNIKDYINHLQMSADEKTAFLEIILSEETGILQGLIHFGRFDEAQDIMEWKCGSNPEGMIKLRKKIIKSSVMYCSSYVESNKWDLIEKYVKWMLNDNDQESSDMKKKILSDEFLRDQFWIVWINNRKESLKSAQIKCLKFLKYFYKSEEINSIIKVKLVEDVKFFTSAIYSANNIKITANFSINLDEVMEFCSVSPDRVKEIKDKILNGIDVMFWLHTCGDPSSFLVLNEIFNWLASNDEGEKKMLIRKASISSEKVGELCIDFLKRYGSSSVSYACKQATKIWFTEWVKSSCLGVDEIRKNVKKYKAKDEMPVGVSRYQKLDVTDSDIKKTLDFLNFCKMNPTNLILKKLEQGL